MKTNPAKEDRSERSNPGLFVEAFIFNLFTKMILNFPLTSNIIFYFINIFPSGFAKVPCDKRELELCEAKGHIFDNDKCTCEENFPHSPRRMIQSTRLITIKLQKGKTHFGIILKIFSPILYIYWTCFFANIAFAFCISSILHLGIILRRKK